MPDIIYKFYVTKKNLSFSFHLTILQYFMFVYHIKFH